MSFEKEIARIAPKIEARLEELLDFDPDCREARLWSAMGYSALGGGKRLRGFLAMKFCSLCGASEALALDYAAAIEMVHAFSLIHDDLPAMDDDDLRRGKPSCHIAYDQATAILAGDALALNAFYVAGENRQVPAERNAEAMILLSKNSGSMGMTGGQQIDLDSEGLTTEADEIIRLIDMKTGALISCACVLGCIAAGADKNAKRSASIFGTMCGRAFQITDDLLDLNSTSEQLGKTAQKDEKAKKSTLVSLFGQKGATEAAKSCIFNAKNALSDFPKGRAKTCLLEFCDYILTREK